MEMRTVLGIVLIGVGCFASLFATMQRGQPEFQNAEGARRLGMMTAHVGCALCPMTTGAVLILLAVVWPKKRSSGDVYELDDAEQLPPRGRRLRDDQDDEDDRPPRRRDDRDD